MIEYSFYTRETNFSMENGIVSLHPIRGKFRLASKNDNHLDSCGRQPSYLITKCNIKKNK